MSNKNKHGGVICLFQRSEITTFENIREIIRAENSALTFYQENYNV